MSSGCGDVLSLADLQTAKKHQLFEAEVITGKQGGVSSGASIDYATNPVTGQIQKTMPAILRDIGFEPASFDFTSGGTLSTTDRNKAVLWPLADGGDGDWYYWEGALPKVIPAASSPTSTGGVAEGAWRPVGDITLRDEISDPDGASLYPDLQIARWRDEGDIRGWGAIGNANEAGTAGTDDTATIRAALSSGKKKLKIPANHFFLVTDTIIIPSDIAIVGEDKFTSCIVASVTMEGSLDVMQNAGYNTAPVTFDNNIVLSNFRIHANGFTRTNAVGGEWGRCLRTGAVRNIYITDMVFQEGPQHCLDLACWRNSHENAGHAGVVQGMTENAVVTNCDIIDYCRDDGLTTHGASGVTIDGCVSRITDYAKSVNNYSITQNGFEIDDGSYNVIVTNCRAYCNNTFSKGFSTANHENNPPPHNVRFINCDTYEGVSGVSLLGAINSSVAFGTENWRARNYVIHNCSLIYPHAATGADYPSRAVEARIVMDVDIRNFRVQMRGENGEAARSPCAITNIDTAVNVSFDGLRVEGVPDGDMGTGFGTGRAWFRISNTETHNIRIRNVSIDNIGWADRIINDNTNVAGAAALKVVDGIYLGRNSTDGRQKTAVMSSAFADFKNVNVPAGVQALRIGRQFFDRSVLGSRVEVNYDSPKAIIGGLKIISETAADSTQPVPGILFDRQFTSSSNQNGKGCIASRTSAAAPGSFNLTAYDEDTGRYEPMLAVVWTAAGTIKKYIAPVVDGDMNNGNAGARWLNVHSVNGVITTSDADDKFGLRDTEEVEDVAFAKIARLPSVWKWIRRVEEEGEDARWHSGPTVQAAIAIMEECGLNWSEYSCFCYDYQPYVPERIETVPALIDDETGEVLSPEHEVLIPEVKESSGYGFRKEELLWWCNRALVSQLDRMEERLARLEGQ